MQLTIKNLTKTYGEKVVLKDIDFTFEEGKIYGLIGRNGAGKTTFFNCLNEDVEIDKGEVILSNEYGENKLTTEDIGYVISTPTVPEFLTGKEFLTFFLEINKDKIKEEKSMEEYFDLVKINKEDQDKLLKEYSHGMKNKMQMLINFIANPKVLLLDEPLTSLDVVVQEEMKQLLKNMKKGHILIFSTHILEIALDLCDEIVILNNKKLELIEKKIASETDKSLTGVPVTIIGQTIITGFSIPTEHQIQRAVAYYSETKHHDIVKEIQEGTYETLEELPEEEFLKQEAELSKKTTVTLPILKEIDFKNYDITTAIPILGVLASLSLPVLWLIITFASIVSIQKEKKTRIRLLSLGLLLITCSSLFSAILKIGAIDWICRIGILLICLLLVINKTKELNLSDTLLKGITIIIAIMIGWLTPSQYWNVLNEIINIQSLSIVVEILYNIYFLISYLIPYIVILLICHIPWKKVSKEHQHLIQLSVWIATIAMIIFI